MWAISRVTNIYKLVVWMLDPLKNYEFLKKVDFSFKDDTFGYFKTQKPFMDCLGAQYKV